MVMADDGRFNIALHRLNVSIKKHKGWDNHLPAAIVSHQQLCMNTKIIIYIVSILENYYCFIKISYSMVPPIWVSSYLVSCIWYDDYTSASERRRWVGEVGPSLSPSDKLDNLSSWKIYHVRSRLSSSCLS